MLSAIVNDNDRILVRQIKEWGEILVGFESRNRYELFDEGGRVLAHAAEEGGGFARMLFRNFFGHMRSARLHLLDPHGHQELALGQKPFRIFFQRMEVMRDGRLVGVIQRKFSIFHRVFEVEDAAGRVILTIRSPWLRIWTFKILSPEDREVGAIRKKWGGILREAFTDADTFGVEFDDPGLSEDTKVTLLIGTFLIDFTCFENNNRR